MSLKTTQEAGALSLEDVLSFRGEQRTFVIKWWGDENYG